MNGMDDTIRLADGISLDPVRLAETRGLIQASSGGGKSLLLRLIVEGVADRMPVLVIDPEGEFYTVRERVGMVLIGSAGEIPCRPESAAKVARAVLEESMSAIVDLSDLPSARHDEYVGEFLRAIMHAPRSCWRPTLIAIDEAHRFCAERAADGFAAPQVIDLMSRGRKRGFGGLLLTQRLSKLRKDAVAEAANVWVGRTNLDLDTKRAADAMGMSSREAAQVLPSLRPGEWYAYGPAMAHEGVARFRADLPATQVPRGPSVAVPPVRHAGVIAAVAARISDQAGSDRPATLEEAERRIEDLERRLAEDHGGPVRDKAIDALEEGLEQALDVVAELGAKAAVAGESVLAAIAKLEPAAATLRDIVDAAADRLKVKGGAAATAALGPPCRVRAPNPTEDPAPRPRASGNAVDRVLHALGWWLAAGVETPSLVQVCMVAGISPRSSTIRGARAELRTRGLAAPVDGGGFALTDEGRRLAPRRDPPTLAEWRGLIGTGAARRVFDELAAEYEAIPLGELCDRVGISPTSSTIRGALATLRGYGLVAAGTPVRLTELAAGSKT